MTKKKFYFFVIVVCITGYVWIILSNCYHSTMEGCLFHKITHIPCPSCGSTRSVHALLNGKFTDAFYYNPLGYVIFLLITLLPLWIVFDLICQKDSFIRFYKNIESLFKKYYIAIPAILLVLGNWIWNFFKYL